MSVHEQKLWTSKDILESHFGDSIEVLLFQPKLSRIKLRLRDNNLIFIQYNDYGGYSYSIIFSNIKLDRCRFDNYDDRWEISTRPHHFHHRKSKKGFKSKMVGEPEHNIPLLFDLYTSGSLFLTDFRFPKIS